MIQFWSITFTSEDAEQLRADPYVRMCNQFRSEGSGTDEAGSPQLFKNARHTFMIQHISDPRSSQSKRLDDGAVYEERSCVVKRDGQTVDP